VFHTLSEVKGTDTLSQEKQRIFTPFPDWLKGIKGYFMLTLLLWFEIVDGIFDDIFL
jgi:hypothetical protein